MGRDLLDFKPAFKGWDLLTDAVASGTQPGRRRPFTATVTMADAINDLHSADGGGTPLSASDARQSAFDNENRPDSHTERLSVTNLDEERARLQATAVLRRSARQFLTADVTTIGVTGLRPGRHVNLSGFHAPFDGIYYITQTVHTLSGAGYLTVSSLRRPRHAGPERLPPEAETAMRPGLFSTVMSETESRQRAGRVPGLHFAEVAEITDEGYVLEWLSGAVRSRSAAGARGPLSWPARSAAPTSPSRWATKWWWASKTATSTAR